MSYVLPVCFQSCAVFAPKGFLLFTDKRSGGLVSVLALLVGGVSVASRWFSPIGVGTL